MTSHMLSEGIYAIAKCGADSVTATDRMVVVEATVGSSTAKVPYIIGHEGRPIPCETAILEARRLEQEARPERCGIYEMDGLDSLLRWSKRFAVAETTAAFIDAPALRKPGSIRVVVDDLASAGAYGARRLLQCKMPLALHPRLEAWLGSERTALQVDDFWDFAMRASDELGEATLMSAISNVEVHEESNWTRKVEGDGSVKLVAESSQKGTKVPERFTFSVPVFDSDDERNVHSFSARLTVKLQNKKPIFGYEIVDFKIRLGEALAVMLAALTSVTPNVYLGKLVR